MVGIFVVVGLSGEVEYQSVAGAQVLQAVPDADGNDHEGGASVAEVELVDHTEGGAVVTAVVKHGFNVTLIDEETIDGTCVAAPGADRARKEAGLVNLRNGHAGQIPFGAEDFGDHAMIARHVKHFFEVHALDGFFEQMPILGNDLHILLGCLDHPVLPFRVFRHPLPLEHNNRSQAGSHWVSVGV